MYVTGTVHHTPNLLNTTGWSLRQVQQLTLLEPKAVQKQSHIHYKPSPKLAEKHKRSLCTDCKIGEKKLHTSYTDNKQKGVHCGRAKMPRYNRSIWHTRTVFQTFFPVLWHSSSKTRCWRTNVSQLFPRFHASVWYRVRPAGSITDATPQKQKQKENKKPKHQQHAFKW